MRSVNRVLRRRPETSPLGPPGLERRALHDVLAGSAVVYDWGDRPAEMPAPITRWFARHGVDGVGPGAQT
jgi:hypothetical protein